MSSLVEEFSSRLISAIVPELDKTQASALEIFDRYFEGVGNLGMSVEEYNSLSDRIDWLVDNFEELKSKYPDRFKSTRSSDDSIDLFEGVPNPPVDDAPDTEPEEVLPPSDNSQPDASEDVPESLEILRRLDYEIREFQSWFKTSVDTIDEDVTKVDVDVVAGFSRLTNHLDDVATYLDRRIGGSSTESSNGQKSSTSDRALLVSIASKIDKLETKINELSSEESTQVITNYVTETRRERLTISDSLNKHNKTQKNVFARLFANLKSLDKKVENVKKDVPGIIEKAIIGIMALLGGGLLVKIFTNSIKKMGLIEWLKEKLPENWQWVTSVLQAIKSTVDWIKGAVDTVKSWLGLDKSAETKMYDKAEKDAEKELKAAEKEAYSNIQSPLLREWQQKLDEANRTVRDPNSGKNKVNKARKTVATTEADIANYLDSHRGESGYEGGYVENYEEVMLGLQNRRNELQSARDRKNRYLYYLDTYGDSELAARLEKLETADLAGNLREPILAEGEVAPQKYTGVNTHLTKEYADWVESGGASAIESASALGEFTTPSRNAEASAAVEGTVSDSSETFQPPQSSDESTGIEEFGTPPPVEELPPEEPLKKVQSPNMPFYVTNNFITVISDRKQAIGE